MLVAMNEANTRHDTPGGEPRPGSEEPFDTGPRTTRDEVRDLGRLRRSRHDRKLAGVAGGIARHLDIDPLLVRVAFVVLVFFGGGGLILYGVAWLLVPEEDTGRAVVRVEEGVRTAALVIGGIIAVGSIIGDTIGGFDFPWPLMVIGLVLLVVLGGKQAMDARGAAPVPPPPAPGTGQTTYPAYQPGPPPPPPLRPVRPVDPRRRGPILFGFTVALAALAAGVVGTLDLAGVAVHPAAYPAAVMAVTGLMLLVGAFYGRAGGLILIGMIAATATLGLTAIDDLTAGQIKPELTHASQVKPKYHVGMGEIIIDLTDVEDPANLDGKTLDLDTTLGRIEVIVPKEGIDVDVKADVEVGETKIFGHQKDGDQEHGHDAADTDDKLTIDAHTVVGQIEVRTR